MLEKKNTIGHYISSHSWDETISSTSMLNGNQTCCKLAHQVTNQRQYSFQTYSVNSAAMLNFN